ncbi:TetR/AcrR family transcriptional regulator [Bailinhaonella thermotolerans]|uniref:TetR/AcrR family transcriptional regulator n=1 Tax=Bailinhaonella thermotolerans TaxID=1070861 RepID=A0A3A4ADA6_9ACTN|nr:TetR/AcrR family transcriptional regulator [Bailinhaonella thermotolerans]RJL24040.1 TetR/AcrR family transcriptional regulator [Bailinhaonella thermotolerans]
MLHEQGVEKTTLADIARAVDIPVGNVYHFKAKDDLVEAAIGTHAQSLQAMSPQRQPSPWMGKSLLGSVLPMTNPRPSHPASPDP